MRADRFLRTPPVSPRALAPAAVLTLALLLGLIPNGPAATARDGGPGSTSGGASGGGGPGGASADGRPGGASAGGGPGGASAGGGPGGASAGGAGPFVPAVGRVWPVGSRPPVARGWEPPATAYGRGHRGLDLTAAPGTPVRSVAAGRVSFAGRVAGRAVVSIELTGTGTPPLRTTYAPVRATLEKGAEVTVGEAVGVLEPPDPHCPASCLHWGLRRGDTYLDPLTLLPPWLLASGPSRLLPVTEVPEPGQPAGRAAPAGEPPRRLSPGRRAGPSRPRPR